MLPDLPHDWGSQCPPSSSSHLGHTTHRCIHHCCPLGLAEHPAQSGELKPSQGQGSQGKWDPRASFEQGALGKHHIGGAGGREAAEPRCKLQARFTKAAERATQPRRGGESLGLPPLPQHRTKPRSTQPARPRTLSSDPQPPLCTTDVSGADPVQRVSLPNHVAWVGGSPAGPQHQRPMLPRALGAPGTQGCPARGSPRAARSSICQLASFPRAGRGGPAPGKPPGAPLQAWEGFDICPPRADKVYERLQRCSRPGSCGRAGARPRQGPIPGTVRVSGVRGVQPAALTMGCSLRGSPPRSVPPLSLPWAAACACHPPRSAEPVPEGAGCTRSTASAEPAAAVRGTAGTGACRAGTLPRAARPRGRAGSRHRQLRTSVWGAPAPAPLHPQRLATLPEPGVAVTRRGGPASSTATPVSEHRAAAPTVAMPGTFRGDARHPPGRCQPSLPSMASRVSITPGCQPSPAPAPRPSPTHASCGQAAGRRAGRLQADALCLGLLQG